MAIPSFLNFLEESKQLDEAFNSSPYELTFGKKNAGDIFFTFVDEDEKEFRIQFYTPQGLGKNVRQVFIGQKRGSTYPDAIGRFKNPMRVIASMIEATKQFMATPLGKTIDGFAINFSKKALERGVTLLPKIIRQSGLKQKLNVMDLTYTPIPDRAFVWVVRKGKDPAQVFDGPKMKGVTWDDPDKVGDVPVQNDTTDIGAPTDKQNDDTIPTEGTEATLRSSGFTAKMMDLIETFAVNRGQYHGQPLTRKGVGRLSTTGGLIIQIRFWGIVNGKLSVEVESDLSRDTLMISGPMRDAAKEVVDAIFRHVAKQYTGELEVKIVPISGKPYPVQRISRSQGYSYVDCGSFVMKMADSFANTLKIGKAVKLDIGKDLPRTTMYIQYNRISPVLVGIFSGDKLLVSVDLDASENAVITDNLKPPSNAKFFGETVHGFSVAWDFKFPAGSQLQAAKFVTNVTYDFERNVANINNMLTQNGQTTILNNSYDVALDVNSVQRSLDSRSQMLKDAAAQLSHLGSNSHNPNKLFLNDIVVNKFMEIEFQGKKLSQASNRHAVIDALANAEKMAKSGKTATNLANYAESVRKNTPHGRDIDWQVYVSRDGMTMNLEWSITFRRNTRVGAYREYHDQVVRANQYLRDIYQDSKSKGYNPTEPNIMSKESAELSDDIAEQNEGSAYSEYEQAIGGNMQVKI